MSGHQQDLFLESTSCAQAGPVKGTALPDSDADSPTSEAASGSRSSASSTPSNPVSSSERTSPASAGAVSTSSSKDLPLRGMILRGTFYRQPTWAHLTCVVASSSLPGDLLLPTPTAEPYGTSLNGSPGDGRDSYEGAGKPSLDTMARFGQLPTPTATMAETKGDLIGHIRGTKGSRMLPTPMASDALSSPPSNKNANTTQWGGVNSIGAMAKNGLLPTPQAHDMRGPPGAGTRSRGGRAADLPSAVLLPTPRANRGGLPDSHGSMAAWDQLLPTPTAGDAKNSGSRTGNPSTQAHPGVSLTDVVVRGKMLPTPTTNDAKNASLPPSQMERDGLAGSILRGELLPTPTAQAATQGPGHAESAEGSPNLVSQVGTGGFLAPRFVEFMMFGPALMGWTDLDDDDHDP